MKGLQLLLLCIAFCFSKSKAQVSFTLPANVCLNSSLALSASSGTLPNPQFTWLSTPNAIFSNSITPNTNVTFTAVGNHTILLVAISGTALAFTQNTVNVIANPSPVLTTFPASLCPMSTFSLFASPLAGANYSFGLPGAITVANGTSNVLQVIPPIALPAVYQVSVDLNGCYGYASVARQQFQLHPMLSLTASSVCAGFNSTITAYPSSLTSYTFSILSPSPASVPNANNYIFVASPSVPTIYQVLADSMGCTGTASISIGINPPLNINISASSPTTCIMNNTPKLAKLVTLVANGAANYVWFPYDPFNPCIGNCATKAVRPQTTTCYTATGTTAVCSGSAVKCITVTPQFTVAISPASASICLGETLTLVTSSVGPGAFGSPSAFTHSWIEALNAPPISMSSYLTPTTQVFPQNSTTYSLEVTDSQTCVSLPQVATVQVFPCLSLPEEESLRHQIKVLPNPVVDYCKIETSGSSFSNLIIVDGNARLIKTIDLTQGKGEQSVYIDLSEIPPGVYFLKAKGEHTGNLFYKLVKL
ncbi:MAG: T9SS type A sorting domain-containing protein [Bacteroidia bacterium]|nr:T9SS type A sorting domain-containing protein [Bacteroidia bacterium]